MKRTKSVDDYISAFPPATRKKLNEIRKLIRSEASHAEERISYGIPAFYQSGYLVWFAGYAKHIGFYPGASAIKRFTKKLSKYKSAKGSVQFPLEEPLPAALILEIVKFRVEEKSQETK
ncbi:MAG TPA: DUF1801 domain-containing protein [Bacteroidota bacterium]|nr:DUF1801 domain-containing protein [Bacteroidota bacterium]